VESVAERIEQRLAELRPEVVEVRDESAQHAGHEGARSGGGHFQLTVVSKAFSGKSSQARHRMIYDALAPMMKREIHALAIKAYAPDEI
jgi:BolA protein